MPPKMLPPPRRPDLMELENRLLSDTKNFGILLEKIPRDILLFHKGNIILNPRYSRTDIESCPIFAFFDKDNNVQLRSLRVPLRKMDDSPPLAKRRKLQESAFLSGLDEQILEETPPISWLKVTPPDRYSPALWKEILQTFIKYSLLNWAFDANFEGQLPQPDYDTLVDLFRLLKKTAQYAQSTILRTDPDFVYVQKPVYEEGALEPLLDREQSPGLLDESAFDIDSEMTDASRSMSESGELTDIMGVSDSEGESSDTKETELLHDTSSLEAGTQREKSARGSSTETEDVNMDTPETITEDVNMDAPEMDQILHIANTNQQPIQDHVLALLHKEKRLGKELLSVLPALNTMLFQTVHGDHGESGVLPLRLKIGTHKRLARDPLSGHSVWVSFKVHKKDSVAAPRLLLHTIISDPGEILEIKFNDLFKSFEFAPSFRVVRNSKKGEMHLKAIAKYYFILAANDGLYGFKDHLMPINESLINELCTVCIQTRDLESPEVDSGDQVKAPRGQQKPKVVSRKTFVSDTDDGTAAAVAQAVRRTSRRITATPSKSPHPFPVDPVDSDSGYSAPGVYPVREFEQLAPRKLALGAPMTVEDERTGRTINAFLVQDAEPEDSDGDSGDEIPAAIPYETQKILQERHVTGKLIDDNRYYLKHWKKQGDSAKYILRTAKSRVTRGLATQADFDRESKFQDMSARIIKTRVKTYESSIQGFKDQKKRLDDLAKQVDQKQLKIWDVHRKDAEKFAKAKAEEGNLVLGTIGQAEKGEGGGDGDGEEKGVGRGEGV